MRKAQRNHGIDFLKNLCMIMIVILHIVKAGGIIESTGDPARRCLSVLINSLSNCSVDCFALITGYLMIDKKFKLSRFISLWMQVLFYSALILAAFAVFSPNKLTKEYILVSLFPTASSIYWYYTAYVFLIFLIPFLNLLINSLSKPEANYLAAAVVILLSVVPTLVNYDIFYTYDGYSMLWLMGLYIIGAYICKYSVGRNISAAEAFFIYLLCSLAAWISYPYFGMQWFDYTSPIVLLSAVSLLICALRANWRNKVISNTVSFFAPMAFSTYLIHTHPLLWDNILYVLFKNFTKLPLFWYVPAIICTALAIHICCCLIDFLRIKIFALFRINSLTRWIDKKFEARCNASPKQNFAA